MLQGGGDGGGGGGGGGGGRCLCLLVGRCRCAKPGTGNRPGRRERERAWQKTANNVKFYYTTTDTIAGGGGGGGEGGGRSRVDNIYSTSLTAGGGEGGNFGTRLWRKKMKLLKKMLLLPLSLLLLLPPTTEASATGAEEEAETEGPGDAAVGAAIPEYRIRSKSDCWNLTLMEAAMDLGECDQTKLSTFLIDTVHGEQCLIIYIMLHVFTLCTRCIPFRICHLLCIFITIFEFHCLLCLLGKKHCSQRWENRQGRNAINLFQHIRYRHTCFKERVSFFF